MPNTDEIIEKGNSALVAGLITSGKWLVITGLVISAGIAFFGIAPSYSDIIAVSIMTSVIVAVGGIAIYIRYDKKRDDKRIAENRAEKLELYGSIALLEHYTDMGIVEVNLNTLEWTRMNPQMQHMFGWNIHSINECLSSSSPEEYAHKMAELLFLPGMYKQFVNEILKRVKGATTDPIVFADVQMKHKQGHYVDITMKADIVPYADETKQRLLKIFFDDITERKHQQAVEENVISLNNLLVAYFSKKKGRDILREEMKDALIEMRTKLGNR